MDVALTLSRPFQFREKNAPLFNTEEGRIFILLRYVLIIAAAYLFLFDGNNELPVNSILLIAAALASNVLLSSILKRKPLQAHAVGVIVCADIGWVILGLWNKGGSRPTSTFSTFSSCFWRGWGNGSVWFSAPDSC